MKYSVQEFARLAGVTVKALHHYDRLGLLKARRNNAGYRIYEERDLERLEQIVALRFLGLPLKQIAILLERDALELPQALRLQRTVLEEKRRLIERAIDAIRRAEVVPPARNAPRTAALRKIIEAIQMQTTTEDATEFMRNYYRDEGWSRFRALHSNWPSDAWRELFGEIECALGEDPAGARAQALAARWKKLRLSDSGGDPQIHAGLLKAWNDRIFWPEAVKAQFGGLLLDEVSQFIARAFGAYRRQHFGEIVWEKELDSFKDEEKARPTLAIVDLHFKLEKACGGDPAGKTGQALAARWLELIESRTRSFAEAKPGAKGWYENYLKWMDNWPAEVHHKVRALPMEKLSVFALNAMAHTIEL